MGLLFFVRNLWNTPPRHKYKSALPIRQASLGGTLQRSAPRKRRYDAAKRGRNFGDWVTTGNSANADIWTAITTIRNRSRDLVRNNGYARGAIQKYVDNVIYTGIPFQSQVKDLKNPKKLNDRANTLIETKFKEWAEQSKWCHTAGQLDFNGIQQLVFKSCLESGEIFIRKVKQSFSGSPVPFALEIIEADQLAEDHNSTNGENRIVMGVEVNRWQRPIAYWFYREHPGELIQGHGGYISRELERVPANEIIHLYFTERPNQLRGLPILYSEVTRLKNLGDYEGAEQLAAKLSACIMAIVTSPYNDILSEHKGDEDDDEAELPADEKFEPGIMRTLSPGEDFKAFDPQRPNANLVAFIDNQLRAAGAGIGMNYEQLSNNYANNNYSGTRLSLTNSRDRYKILQIWFATHFLREVIFGNVEADGWLDMAVMAGELNFIDYEMRKKRYCAVKWQFRGWSWIDPYKEVKARVESLSNNMTTLTDHYAEQGQDFEEAMQAIAREREFAKNLGIELSFNMSPINPDPNNEEEKTEHGSIQGSSKDT